MQTQSPLIQETLALHEEIDEILAEKTGVEYEPDDAVIHTPFDPADIRINSRVLTVDLVVSRIKEKEIILDPEFQRSAGIWKPYEQSRLIESLMLRIPLPAFYMDATDDDKWVVIDGLQRLTTLYRFIEEGTLKLSRLEFLSEFEGRGYEELPRNLQRRINETQLTIFIVEPGTPPGVRLNIFKRINTGGTPLSAQEIRHALHLGRVTELLKKLAQSASFLQATANGVKPLRMADRECVLRYLAFALQGHESYREDLDTFLITAMEKVNQDKALDLDEIESQFNQAMETAYALFGARAFRRMVPGDRSTRPPVNKSLFESWAVNLGSLKPEERQQLIEGKDRLQERFDGLLSQDTDFVNAISYSTGNRERVLTRFSKIKMIIEETLRD